MGALALMMMIAGSAASAGDYPIRPAPFTQVMFRDTFWAPRLETNRTVTLPHNFRKCEETGRIDNFAKAGGLMPGKFEGIFFNDSDVFKVVEGAAYCLSLHPDPALDACLDDLIAKFAAAQEPDGYLYTSRTIDPENPQPGSGRERWSHLQHSHELYNVGHMYEAAVAHYLATGKRNFLDIAIKNADLIGQVFGPGKKYAVPGHQEIEIGLSKLYRVTGDERYLQLARFFIDQRGRAEHRELFGEYCQDHKPVVEQDEAVGHAVRAGYFYAGVADVAALTGDTAYIAAIGRIWDNVVSKKLYITGGIGARRHGEAFGDAYELPNHSAYNETCAAIANVLWNHRLFLLHGDAKYLDVLERTLYNGFLSGVGFDGTTYFYPNPLESDGLYAFNQGRVSRQPWFDCACCPTNVVRFVASLPGYVYAQRDNDIYVGLFIAGSAHMTLHNQPIVITQETQYPWDGAVRITVSPEAVTDFTLCVRIPGWAQGRPLPSDLYHYLDAAAEPIALSVNGEAAPLNIDKGFARITRTWKAGDRVAVQLPMPVRRVLANEQVADNRGRVALERGPLVYCAEWVDNGGRALNIILPDDAPLSARHAPDLLRGITVIEGCAKAIHRADDGGEIEMRDQDFMAIPYYAWAHRGEGEMTVWLARHPNAARVPPRPTLAARSRPSASYMNPSDTLAALNDQVEPKNSNDHSIPRFTWWDRKGTSEWVQYDLAEETEVAAVEVYWFDDTGQGQCRVPKSWRVLHKEANIWKPVNAKGDYPCERDRFNRAEFAPVRTGALRLQVQLQPEFSGGILEWRIPE